MLRAARCCALTGVLWAVLWGQIWDFRLAVLAGTDCIVHHTADPGAAFTAPSELHLLYNGQSVAISESPAPALRCRALLAVAG